MSGNLYSNEAKKSNLTLEKREEIIAVYRPIHSMKFSASSGDQLEYNGSQGASGQAKCEN